MTTKTALLALLTLWGVGGGGLVMPVSADDDGPIASEDTTDDASPLERSFANRVWVKSDSGDLPSVIRIFLSDGTLVSDSCWETHRLSPWQMTGPKTLKWTEDGKDIAAEIMSVSTAQLVLKLQLVGGAVEERYQSADVPYVCPDIPA